MKKRNIFICAAGRSGSTLLDLMLGSHSKVTSLGEITQLPKNLALNTACACGSDIQTCLFWSRVLREVETMLGIDVRSDPYSLDLGFIDARVVVDAQHQNRMYNFRRKVYSALVWLKWQHRWLPIWMSESDYLAKMKNNIALFDAVRLVTGKPIVVDSTKHYLKAVGLHKVSPEDTSIVLLTRDGRGVYYSNRRHGFDRRRSIEAWHAHFSHALPILKKNVPSESIIQIKYEDLCADPGPVLRSIAEFSGIEFESTMLDYANHEHHIANGNDMRFIGSSEVRCDDKWRTELAGEELDYFRRYAWRLNHELGYVD